MVISVEEVSSSLVREFLSRKGLKRTMACMDEEHPRTEASINNRSQLRQVLNMETLYRDNKVQSSPLKTLLEIIVKHHIAGPDYVKTTVSGSASAVGSIASETKYNAVACAISKHIKLRSDVEETCSSHLTYTSLLPEEFSLPSNDQTRFWGCDSEVHRGRPLSASIQDNENFIRREPEKKILLAESSQKSKTNRIRRGMMAGPIASAPQESNQKRQSRRAGAPQLPFRKQEEHMQSRDGPLATGSHPKILLSGLSEIDSADSIEGRGELSAPERMQRENSLEKVGQNSLKSRKLKTKANLADLDVSEMVLDDIDDDLQDVAQVSFGRITSEPSFAGRPMDQRTAMELKMVVLGSTLNCFSAEWRNQGFTFSDTHDLRYGIVQRKGGPCGVLASIQAFVLKKLLFENTESSSASLLRLTPSSHARRKCLVFALAEILWRAGSEKQAALAVSSGRNHFTPAGRYKSEGVLEKITLLYVESIKDLQLLFEQHIEQFETGELGCILLTVSAILSRSIEKVKEDMDVPTTALIGAHGYCTQELVNLLLCGRAVSNVFDDDMELDSGNGNITLLKGIKGPCNIGLLSLFEHYNICKVGAYMKTPLYPIWVVCSESHFTVLFGLQRELLTDPGKAPEFDLYYYDGLANQQEEIRLTVSVAKLAMSNHDLDADLTPPLEHCIRTRWTDAFVNWNDTEPIL